MLEWVFGKPNPMVLLATLGGLLQPRAITALRRSAIALLFAVLGLLAVPQASAQEPPASSPLTREFFVGVWEARTYEHGRDVRILWRLYPDGTLDYDFEVDGLAFPGSKGTWEFRDGVMHEHWDRADGTKGQGRGSIEKIDENTISLRILDNGDPSYTGLVRVYRRLGPAQLVRQRMSEPPLPPA